MIPAEKPCTCDVRTTAVEVLGVYDGALYVECRGCRAVWHRWPRDDWRHDKAEAHLVRRMQAQPGRGEGADS